MYCICRNVKPIVQNRPRIGPGYNIFTFFPKLFCCLLKVKRTWKLRISARALYDLFLRGEFLAQIPTLVKYFSVKPVGRGWQIAHISSRVHEKKPKKIVKFKVTFYQAKTFSVLFFYSFNNWKLEAIYFFSNSLI